MIIAMFFWNSGFARELLEWNRGDRGGAKMPSLSLRINLDPDGRIGPGKIELLEQIAAFGSISAAARGMEMSYKHRSEERRVGKECRL